MLLTKTYRDIIQLNEIAFKYIFLFIKTKSLDLVVRLKAAIKLIVRLK